MDKYGDTVYRIALTHTLNKSEAEDIFQEVFLSLVTNYKTIENEEHLKHWLIRSAVNRCISCNRRLKFYGKTAEEISEDNDDTAAVELKIMLSELPEKYRSVIYLCCFEKYTAREAAEILGKREGTVKSLLSRGRKRLKKDLEENL